MKAFFLLVEILIYVFALYLLIKKGELAIMYVPLLEFANNTIDPLLSASFFYITITTLFIFFIIKNTSYYKNNFFGFLLCLYFIFLLPNSSDIVFIRPYMFGVLWLFTFIPLVNSIYKKYPREVVFKELCISSTLILILFIINVLVSSAKGFSPHDMYGITKGILYGNIFAAGFNVVAIAVFINTLKYIDKKRVVDFIILFVALAFLMLSFRRSVMGISLLGLFIGYFSLLTKEKAKTFIIAGGLAFIAGYTIFTFTDFQKSFKERFELRKLDERELEEEKRFIEYELLYKDMFVYKDYSPLFGYELFNSWNNYGRGVLVDRSLHGDLTNIAHSSGLIGVFLYVMMIITAFGNSFKSATNRLDTLILLFCSITIVVFTITGRYTAISSMMLFFLVLMLPIAKGEHDEEINEEDRFDKFKRPFQINGQVKV